MFVISVIYTSPLEEVDRHLEAHVTYLQQQYGKGNFMASGRKVPRTGGVILSRLNSRDELDAILAKDPFSIAGIAEYEITEFVVSMVAPGFENLKEQ